MTILSVSEANLLECVGVCARTMSHGTKFFFFATIFLQSRLCNYNLQGCLILLKTNCLNYKLQKSGRKEKNLVPHNITRAHIHML